MRASGCDSVIGLGAGSAACTGAVAAALCAGSWNVLGAGAVMGTVSTRLNAAKGLGPGCGLVRAVCPARCAGSWNVLTPAVGVLVCGGCWPGSPVPDCAYDTVVNPAALVAPPAPGITAAAFEFVPNPYWLALVLTPDWTAASSSVTPVRTNWLNVAALLEL